MRLTILNGSPTAGSLDAYLSKLISLLEKGGHAVTHVVLRDMKLYPCTGCFKCWVKTPGRCILKDDSDVLDRIVINSDLVLWASPLIMGFPSALFKTALDKHLPLIHPYMEIDQGEIHHIKRYAKYPRIGMLLEKEAASDEKDLEIVTNIFARTALNFKSRLEFVETLPCPVEELIEKIEHPQAGKHLYQKQLKVISFDTIQAPAGLILFNGSPRGSSGSNTLLMLEELSKGFAGPTEIYHLQQVKNTPKHVQAFSEADCVWIGFPLYTDGMPGIVKHFIEALEPLLELAANPPVGFLVQSGFPEACHSRYVERYLQRLAARLGSPYLGTIVKGNAEGLHVMPPKANRKLFARLQALGASLSNEGHLDENILRQIANPEHIPVALVPVVSLGLRFSVAGFYFNSQMKENGVFERRFEQPFLER